MALPDREFGTINLAERIIKHRANGTFPWAVSRISQGERMGGGSRPLLDNGDVRGLAVGELQRRAPKWKGPRDEWLVCEDVKIPELTSGPFC